MKQLTEILGASSKVGFSKAMSLGWIAIDKSGGAPKVTRKTDKIEDEVQRHLAAFAQGKGDDVQGNG
jgi:phenylalanyl-tRNA synthetase alpha chain